MVESVAQNTYLTWWQIAADLRNCLMFDFLAGLTIRPVFRQLAWPMQDGQTPINTA